MCKRLSAVFALLLTLMITTACQTAAPLSDSEAEQYKSIHRSFSHMRGYSARVCMTVYGNKTKQAYELTQRIEAPHKAKITVTAPESLRGLTITYNGDSVSLRQEGVGETQLKALPAFDYTRLDEFFSLYYRSENTAVSAGGGMQGGMLLETAVIPRTSEQYKLTLLFEGKKPTPHILTLYDAGGNIRMTAEYFDFLTD